MPCDSYLPYHSSDLYHTHQTSTQQVTPGGGDSGMNQPGIGMSDRKESIQNASF